MKTKNEDDEASVKADEKVHTDNAKHEDISTWKSDIKAAMKVHEFEKAVQVDIEKYEADAERLAKETAKHGDIPTWKSDMKAATKVRELEKAVQVDIEKYELSV